MARRGMDIRSVARRVAAVSPAAKELRAAMDELRAAYDDLVAAEAELAPKSAEFKAAEYDDIDALLPGLRESQKKVADIQRRIDEANKKIRDWHEVLSLELRGRDTKTGPGQEARQLTDELDDVTRGPDRSLS